MMNDPGVFRSFFAAAIFDVKEPWKVNCPYFKRQSRTRHQLPDERAGHTASYLHQFFRWREHHGKDLLRQMFWMIVHHVTPLSFEGVTHDPSALAAYTLRVFGH